MNDDKGLVELLNARTTWREVDAGTRDLIEEAAARIQVLSDRIAVLDALLSAGSVAMSPHERVRWIDRVRKHLDTSPQESSSNAE